MSGRPTLWHIPISHFSEKARWALDHKRVAYRRRAPPPGAHMAIAAALSRGRSVTFPLLRIEGTSVADSTEIIAELERRFPQHPLYPSDPSERERALELEDYFDRGLGPAIRRFAWHHLSSEPEMIAEALAEDLPPELAESSTARAGLSRAASGFVRLRYKAGDAAGAERARQTVLDSLDRLETELGEGEYLVAEDFSVADLTAASLFYPLVSPPQAPRQVRRPAAFEEFRRSQSERAGYRWVERIFARHRRPDLATSAD